MATSSIEKRARKATSAHLKRVESGLVNINPDGQVSLHLLAILRPPPPPEASSVHLKRVMRCASLLVLLFVGCTSQPIGPNQPAGKAADPFTNSAYHFGFDLRWHGPVPDKVKQKVESAAGDLSRILRFNLLLSTYLAPYTDLELNGVPDSIGGEWVGNKVIVYVSHSSWSGVEIKDGVWGLGGAILLRSTNENGLFYMAKPLVGRVTISSETPSHMLYRVALHELIHVMGFGLAFLEERDGTPPNTSYKYAVTSTGNRHFWLGGMAKSIYGISGDQWRTHHVPLHSDKAHWAESINDLMNPKTGQPLTTLTLGFLADLGYVVDDEGVQIFNRAAAKPPVLSPADGDSLRCGVDYTWLQNVR